MGNCYLCGCSTDKHDIGCPNYKPPRPIITFLIKGKTWRLDVVSPGNKIPDWATHAWYRDDGHLATIKCTLDELAAMWERHCHRNGYDEPDCTIRHKGYSPGETYQEYRSYD